MAVKIVRQVKSIALLGAPTSAAGLGAGQEGAPAALRSAGLAERLTAAGFQVTDYGDCAPRVYKPDDEHPRARNASEALAILEELRPKVETAVKSGALAVILAGDDTTVLAAIAGSRRYYRHVSVISVDRDAGLNVPATTPSGCLDGMVISHIVGRGAPELVRFWGEPPLIREPDVAVFGIDRVDEPEQKWLGGSPLQHYLAVDIKRRGAAVAAQEALERVHGSRREFVLLLDLDAIAAEDFAATNFPGSAADSRRNSAGGGRFCTAIQPGCICDCRLQSRARYGRKGSENSDRFAGRRAGSAFAGASCRGDRGYRGKHRRDSGGGNSATQGSCWGSNGRASSRGSHDGRAERRAGLFRAHYVFRRTRRAGETFRGALRKRTARRVGPLFARSD